MIELRILLEQQIDERCASIGAQIKLLARSLDLSFGEALCKFYTARTCSNLDMVEFRSTLADNVNGVYHAMAYLLRCKLCDNEPPNVIPPEDTTNLCAEFSRYCRKHACDMLELAAIAGGFGTYAQAALCRVVLECVAGIFDSEDPSRFDELLSSSAFKRKKNLEELRAFLSATSRPVPAGIQEQCRLISALAGGHETSLVFRLGRVIDSLADEGDGIDWALLKRNLDDTIIAGNEAIHPSPLLVSKLPGDEVVPNGHWLAIFGVLPSYLLASAICESTSELPGHIAKMLSDIQADCRARI